MKANRGLSILLSVVMALTILVTGFSSGSLMASAAGETGTPDYTWYGDGGRYENDVGRVLGFGYDDSTGGTAGLTGNYAQNNMTVKISNGASYAAGNLSSYGLVFSTDTGKFCFDVSVNGSFDSQYEYTEQSDK